jgi:hypothetical protein
MFAHRHIWDAELREKRESFDPEDFETPATWTLEDFEDLLPARRNAMPLPDEAAFSAF